MKPLLLIGFLTAILGFFLTPNQLGFHYFKKGDFSQAATAFEDPMWKGAAYYRAKDFKSAAAEFSRSDSPEALFNRGNALVFLGQYENAVKSFDRALSAKSDWKEAQENRDLAQNRADNLKSEGGDMGDQELGADEIVFDKQANNQGQNTELEADQASSDSTVQALWLRQVQTQPADFLKAKFAYQDGMQEEEVSNESP